jgi:hypothetical protein
VEAVIEPRAKSLYAEDLFIRVGRVLRRVFGCWHLKMSLPFTRGKLTYRTCIACGARRRFDLDRWVMVGPYYHPIIRQPHQDARQLLQQT